MVRGIVNERGEPIVRVALASDRGKLFTHPAVIDTGFNGALSVPESIVRRYSWRWIGYESYEIATGDVVRRKVFLGSMRWFGREEELYVVVSHAKDILIGTQLLKNRQLRIDFKKNKLLIL